MVDITLYCPRDINYTIQFPQQWNDCLLSELLCIANYIFEGNTTQPELFLALIQCRIKHHFPKLSRKQVNRIIARIDVDDLATAYSDLLLFIFESVTLTKQPCPVIAKRFFGPDSDFENITVGEFEDADNLMYKFRETVKTDKAQAYTIALDIAKLLYRTKQHNVRVPLGKYQYSPAELRQFSKVPKSLVYTIKLWFMGCKSMLPVMFPLVFNQHKKNEQPDDDTEPAEMDPMAFTKLIHLGAGPKNGTRDQIRSMRLLEFLFDLNIEFEKNTIG